MSYLTQVKKQTELLSFSIAYNIIIKIILKILFSFKMTEVVRQIIQL